MPSLSKFRPLLLAGLCLASLGPVQAGDFDDAAVMRIDYPAWFKDSFLDLPEDIQDARDAGKQGMMILFTTEGCSYCAQFIRTSLNDPAIEASLRANFDVIGLEIFSDAEMIAPDGSAERVKSFAKSAGAGFAPTVLFYGENGEPLYRGVGYHDPERFAAVLRDLNPDQASSTELSAKTEAPPADATATYALADDSMFRRPPYALDRSQFAAERPLLVIFESDTCKDCARFHQEVLKQPDVRDLLERFEVVRLDAADKDTPLLKPDGEAATPADWWAETGFEEQPALLFIDEQGQEVLRTDALVLRQRMINSLLYVLERAYEKDWTYQRFARSRALARMRDAQDSDDSSQ